jgi:uncharacterized membrane protein
MEMLLIIIIGLLLLITGFRSNPQPPQPQIIYVQSVPEVPPTGSSSAFWWTLFLIVIVVLMLLYGAPTI